jgi:CheY-like chemotaxis protein
MRGIDGLELVRMMQVQPRLSSISVVLIDVLDAEATAAGAAATIAKPFGVRSLVEVLTRVLPQ